MRTKNVSTHLPYPIAISLISPIDGNSCARMLAFCTCEGTDCTVRLVYIQFKRTPPTTCVAALNIVHNEKFDQYERVSSWHDPEAGTTAMYGMFSPKLGILETVSAMDVATIKHAINNEVGKDSETSPSSWELKDGKVNWTKHAESMPTILAKTLGGMTGFTSLDAAVDWIDNKLKNTSVQPKYWVIQAMGGRESALNKNLSNTNNRFYESVKSLAEKYGYQKCFSLERKPKNLEMVR